MTKQLSKKKLGKIKGGAAKKTKKPTAPMTSSPTAPLTSSIESNPFFDRDAGVVSAPHLSIGGDSRSPLVQKGDISTQATPIAPTITHNNPLKR